MLIGKEFASLQAFKGTLEICDLVVSTISIRDHIQQRQSQIISPLLIFVLKSDNASWFDS